MFFNTKGAIAVKALFLSVFFVLGIFWFIGKEAREIEHLSFSDTKDSSVGQSAEILRVLRENASTTDSIPNKTLEFAGTLVNTYINPVSLSEETTKISAKEDLEKILSEIAPTISYHDEKDLVVTKDQKEIEKYGERFFSAKKEAFFPGLGDEALIFTKTIHFSPGSERESAIEQLRKSASVYKTFSERLIQIPIPENKKEEHLTYVNAIIDLSIGSENLANGLLDPLYSLVGVHFYQKGVLMLAKFK
jgi:hypothetical protein